MDLRLRPINADDLDMLRRFWVEPGLMGLDWNGFRDAGAVTRRFESDGYLGQSDGWLVVEHETAAAGVVTYREMRFGNAGVCLEIGILLLPEFRGRGLGWRAQAVFADHLFQHRPVQRIQAGTHPENIAEQKALVKAGFQFEGVLRSCEFRAGQWRDCLLYSRLRDDPAPDLG